MRLIGEKVRHISFGEGTIKEINDKKITVTFDIGEKSFDYPYVFDKFLALENEELKGDIQEKKNEIEEEKARISLALELERSHEKQRRENEKRNSRKGGTLKAVKDNIAFKCNFHDEEDDSVCFEGKMLKEWRAYAGVIQSGVNKGKPKTIKKVAVNNLAVLTSKIPKKPEKDRFIFAAFLVNENVEGGEVEEGYVEAHPEYKISLSEEESKKIKFWDYYYNESNPEKIQASGVNRYISDEQSAQILKNIYNIKKGTSEEELAKGILEKFCQYKGLDVNNLSEPEGALKR